MEAPFLDSCQNGHIPITDPPHSSFGVPSVPHTCWQTVPSLAQTLAPPHTPAAEQEPYSAQTATRSHQYKTVTDQILILQHKPCSQTQLSDLCVVPLQRMHACKRQTQSMQECKGRGCRPSGGSMC